MLKVHIITPERAVVDTEADSITCQTTEGEITILPHHSPLLTLLADGIIVLRRGNEEEVFSAGGGYVETDGAMVRFLISRAYGQDELDEKTIAKVEEEAKKLIAENKGKEDRDRAFAMLRRANLDLKTLKRRRHRV